MGSVILCLSSDLLLFPKVKCLQIKRMDPFDPTFSISLHNPAVQITTLVIAVGLVGLLWSTFRGDAKRAGLVKTIALWVWCGAFFPAAIITAKHYGWWVLAVILVWLIPLSAFDRLVLTPQQKSGTRHPSQ